MDTPELEPPDAPSLGDLLNQDKQADGNYPGTDTPKRKAVPDSGTKGKTRFCTNCGREIAEKAVVCIGCGVPVKPAPRASQRKVLPSQQQSTILTQTTRYCTNCGNEISSGAFICMNCGVPVKSINRSVGQSRANEPWTTGVMALLVIGTIIMPLVGLVAGATSLKSEAKRNQAIVLLALGIIMIVANFTLLSFSR